MTFEFRLYPPEGGTSISLRVDAATEDDARAELVPRMASFGISAHELRDWRVGVTIVGKGRA